MMNQCGDNMKTKKVRPKNTTQFIKDLKEQYPSEIANNTIRISMKKDKLENLDTGVIFYLDVAKEAVVSLGWIGDFTEGKKGKDKVIRQLKANGFRYFEFALYSGGGRYIK